MADSEGVRSPLTIAVAQPFTVAHDVASNASRHADAIREADAALVIFPELSLTGYEFAADPVDLDSPDLTAIVDACHATGATALAGAPIRENERDFIAMLAFDPAGVSVVYRKMWLGAQEAVRFSPGSAPARFDVGGWRCGLAICKDTEIVEHAAATAALGIDLYVAGVVEAAADTATIEERAIRVARDHGVFVATASCAGSTGEGYVATAGRSGVWDRSGQVIVRADATPGRVVKAVLV